MSALAFRPYLPRLHELGFCDNRCQIGGKGKGSAPHAGPAMAAFKLSILDRPAGQFCPRCKKSMEEAYEGALAA